MVIRFPSVHVVSWASSQCPATAVSVVPLTLIVDTCSVSVGAFGSDPSKLKPSPISICAVNPAGSGFVTTFAESPAALANPSRMNTVCVGRAGLENTMTRASPSMTAVLAPSLAIHVVRDPILALALTKALTSARQAWRRQQAELFTPSGVKVGVIVFAPWLSVVPLGSVGVVKEYVLL